MVIPYTMIHFSKPMGETFDAIVAGFALGYLALRTRSVPPGIILHWGVAFLMDALAVLRQTGSFVALVSLAQ